MEAISQRHFRQNTALLTVSGLLMRSLGMVWQSFLVRRLGSGGMGLLQLTSSAGLFFSTLSASGGRFALTRLLSEERGLHRYESTPRVMGAGALYALLCGGTAFALLRWLALSVGLGWIGDAGTVRPLELLAFSLPAMSLSGIFSGYFTAVGRPWKGAAEQLTEQLLRMGFTVLLLRNAGGDAALCCRAVMAAGALSDWCGAGIYLSLYAGDRRRWKRSEENEALLAAPPAAEKNKTPLRGKEAATERGRETAFSRKAEESSLHRTTPLSSPGAEKASARLSLPTAAPSPGPSFAVLWGRLLALALPLALSAYGRSALSTLRQMLTPKMLRRGGLSPEAALSFLGTVGGMALPLLSFPAAVLYPLSELLLPVLTELQVNGKGEALRRRVGQCLRNTLFFSLASAAFFLLTAEPLCWAVYGNTEAAPLLRVLTPLVPLMYVDIVTDGCLKGLGQMLRSMTFNVAEGVLGLVLAVLLLPRGGEKAYLLILYLCEGFNFSLSLGCLYRVLAPKREGSFPPGRRRSLRRSPRRGKHGSPGR